MNILILGATGRVGSQIVNHALHDGHHVIVLARTPKKIKITNENLTIFEGNALNNDDILRVINGVDVVISALDTDGTTTLSSSIPLIINAMIKTDMKRIITIGTAGILKSRTTPHLLRYQSSESKHKSTRATGEHHIVFNLLKQSELEWTIVCPTYLPDGSHQGIYRVERDFLPEGGSQISVLDTAEFAYNQIYDKKYIRARVGIAY